MLSTILSGTLTIENLLICLTVSLVLGIATAWLHSLYNESSKGFIMTLALLPAMVQMVIMLVNGNLGTGIAVMGAFSLVRFRSIPGSAKDISSIFFSMAIGLATGTGYLVAAFVFVMIVGGVSMVFNISKFGETKHKEKELKITIPESLDYTGVFDDLFEKYTAKSALIRVKTSNMGSLYKLEYRIKLKNLDEEKAFIDEIRCRNGNLEISCGKVSFGSDEL